LIHKCVESENASQLLTLILDCGVDQNTKKVMNLTTPLHLASQYGNLEIVKILLSYGADARH
jgi:ankyrin repeat protein